VRSDNQSKGLKDPLRTSPERQKSSIPPVMPSVARHLQLLGRGKRPLSTRHEVSSRTPFVRDLHQSKGGTDPFRTYPIKTKIINTAVIPRALARGISSVYSLGGVGGRLCPTPMIETPHCVRGDTLSKGLKDPSSNRP